jgi:hypothetical protein
MRAWYPSKSRAAVVVGSALLLSACGTDGPSGPIVQGCAISLDLFHDGGPERSTIPFLDNPKLTIRYTPDVLYAGLNDIVIGFEFNGRAVAIPQKFLWHHELVNMDVPGEGITVTYSPLTGSSAVFDRSGTGIGPMSVSNYVLNSGLVAEDAEGTLRPQLSTIAACGPGDGSSMSQLPFEEMTLRTWWSIHPDSWVASSDNGPEILYQLFPYDGDYRQLHSPLLVYPVEGGIDPRRPPKELVLGIRSGTGGISFPLRVLDQLTGGRGSGATVSAGNAVLDGQPITVFWNSTAQAARAYKSTVEGWTLHFEREDNTRVDQETGSVWNFSGQAVAGPLAGKQLEPIPDIVIAYWFAWASFQPDTDIWSPPPSASLAPPEQLSIPTDDDPDLLVR